jgi:hypothetical protein
LIDRNPSPISIAALTANRPTYSLESATGS